MSDIQIRAAEENDLPILYAFLKIKATHSGNEHDFVATPHALRDAFFSEAPRSHVVVAVMDECVVGMATFFDTFSSYLAKPCIWLDDLYVDEPYRSKGVGEAILKHICVLARQKGCGRIEWTVDNRNAAAKQFYSRIGARISDIFQLVRLDACAIDSLSNDAL